MTDPKRILIVDDHPLLRKGLLRLINSTPTLAVCGEAGNADEAMTLIEKLKPDLVVLDIGLPGASGIDLTEKIRTAFPKLPILILSMHDEALYVSRALQAGALGYVMKQDAIENLTKAVTEALDGRRYISPAIAQNILIDTETGVGVIEERDPTTLLSNRELEIFRLIGSGHEVREISETLGVSPKTVDSHRGNIKQKLNIKTARQLARLAVQWSMQHGG